MRKPGEETGPIKRENHVLAGSQASEGTVDEPGQAERWLLMHADNPLTTRVTPIAAGLNQ